MKNYQYANKYRQNREELLKKYSSDSGPVKVTNNSEDIYNKLKEETFADIFKDLDKDGDDKITIININVENLPQEILNILKPIVEELRDEDESLTCTEFVRAMHHLFEVSV